MDRQEIIDYFLELVTISSPSKDERKIADKLKYDLIQQGFAVEEDNSAYNVDGNTGNIIARLKGNTEKPTLLFCAHMDTVSETSGINPIINNDIIYSDGTTILGADDKVGICAIIQGIKFAMRNNIKYGDIEVVFTVCEEQGLMGSKNLDTDKLNARIGFILDGGGPVGKIITRAPAKNKLHLKVMGKPVHAGIEPEKGISAIKVAGDAIACMQHGRIDFETTANIGKIRGGHSTNIVAELVEMEAEVRSLNKTKLFDQTEHMVDTVKQAAKRYGAQTECEVIGMYPYYNLKEDSYAVRYAIEAIKRLGINPELISSGGGSDGNILNNKGIQCVTLSSGFFNAHSVDEYLPINDLVLICRLVETIIQI